MSVTSRSVQVIACGALARELKLLQRRGGLDHVSLRCLPAKLHNTPDEIPAAVRKVMVETSGCFANTFVAFADCGTGGRLDSVLKEFDVERLPGTHCYEFFAGAERFAALHDDEPGTFYLTDFLVRHFDRLVFDSLGLNQHPELLPQYFGNYSRVVHLAQVRSPQISAKARTCAERLGLEFESIFTGVDSLSPCFRSEDGRVVDAERVD